jgi:DNA polymerase-3 subunit alpha
MEYELAMIEQMGFASYFIIVWDFIHFARQNNIYVGPGRGSAAGSIVAYCLGITDLDPIRYELLFERFLNPERVSYPDIDTDIEFSRRPEVIQYMTRKYGAENVCRIVTFGTLAAKQAIRDVARCMGHPASY